MNYTVYNPATGDIEFNIIGSVVEGDVPEGFAVAEGKFDSQQYIYDTSQQTFIERPVLSLQYSTDPVTVDTYFRIDGIPEGATVAYPGGSLVVDDGFIEWTTDIPGNHTFTVTAPPHLPQTITVTFED